MLSRSTSDSTASSGASYNTFADYHQNHMQSTTENKSSILNVGEPVSSLPHRSDEAKDDISYPLLVSSPLGAAAQFTAPTHFKNVHELVDNVTSFLESDKQVAVRRVARKWQGIIDERGALKATHDEAKKLVVDHNDAIDATNATAFSDARRRFKKWSIFGLIHLVFTLSLVLIGYTKPEGLGPAAITFIAVLGEVSLVAWVLIFIYYCRRGNKLIGIRRASLMLITTGFAITGMWFIGSVFTENKLRAEPQPLAECSKVWNATYNLEHPPSQMLFLRPDLWRFSGRAFVGHPNGNDQTNYFGQLELMVVDPMTVGINCAAANEDPVAYAANYSRQDPLPQLPADFNWHFFPRPSLPFGWENTFLTVISVAGVTNDWPLANVSQPVLLQSLRSGIYGSTQDVSSTWNAYEIVWAMYKVPVVTLNSYEAPSPAMAYAIVIACYILAIVFHTITAVDLFRAQVPLYVSAESSKFVVPHSLLEKAVPHPLRKTLNLQSFRALRALSRGEDEDAEVTSDTASVTITAPVVPLGGVDLSPQFGTRSPSMDDMSSTDREMTTESAEETALAPAVVKIEEEEEPHEV